MVRRTLTLAALVLLFAVSGAMAGQWNVKQIDGNDGYVLKELTFTPGTIDTADYVGLDEAGEVNDSLIFTSPLFTIRHLWTVAVGRVFYVTQDTLSTIDSIGYDLQSKFESDYDSTWWTIATCAKADEDLINTNPASADIHAYFDADSLGVADAFRLRVALIAEEAQWRAKDASGLLQFNAVYRWRIMFVHKGNQ